MNQPDAPDNTPGSAAENQARRLPLWILTSVVVGFLLPVCSCLAVGITMFVAAAASPVSPSVRPTTSNSVAIIQVDGTIFAEDGTDFTSGASSGIIVDQLRKAGQNPDIVAIVLRVDSPGGSVVGSAQIYETLLGLEKPVVVSMASTAASGGYYISVAADHIFARPNTITGSIGVVITVMNAEELLADVGIESQMITSGENKAFGSIFEELTPEQTLILQELVDETYDEFVSVVAAGRDLSEEEVRKLADGRIFSGRQALALGLVDELGNLDYAVQHAAELAGISGDPNIYEYRYQPTLQDLLSGMILRLRQSDTSRLLDLASELATPELQYRYVGPGVEQR